MISGPDDEVTEEEQMKPTDTVKLSKFLTRAGQVCTRTVQLSIYSA